MNDVVIGAWRNGLTPSLAGDVKFLEERLAKGFRLLPYESTVVELAQILDGYDAFACEILPEEGKTINFDPLEFSHGPMVSPDQGVLPFAGEMDDTGKGAAELLGGFAPTNNYTQERNLKPNRQPPPPRHKK